LYASAGGSLRQPPWPLPLGGGGAAAAAAPSGNEVMERNSPVRRSNTARASVGTQKEPADAAGRLSTVTSATASSVTMSASSPPIGGADTAIKAVV